MEEKIQVLTQLLQYCQYMKNCGYNVDDFIIEISLEVADQLGLEINYNMPEDTDVRFTTKEKVLNNRLN